MNIRPLADRVVVGQLDVETTSAGGITLPGAAAESDILAVIERHKSMEKTA
ncbi:MAG: hypothetical protein ABR612_12600 [Chromatocurvus sp.]